MNRAEISAYLDFAVETAYLAGRLTLAYFQTGVQPEYKSDRTPVTIADRKAEELIRRRIRAAYPHHAVLGEEFGVELAGDPAEPAEFRWLIDPIDGTKSFVHGVPLYGVLLGLEIAGQIAVGAAYFPALDEMVAAGHGLGCRWNGRLARVSSVKRLSEAVFTVTSSNAFTQLGCDDVFDRLADACYYQTGWTDAYGYLLVATGRAELMVDPSIQIWDCAPFPVILSEAGGYFGDWEGRPGVSSTRCLATTETLLPEVLAIIHPAES